MDKTYGRKSNIHNNFIDLKMFEQRKKIQTGKIQAKFMVLKLKRSLNLQVKDKVKEIKAKKMR